MFIKRVIKPLFVAVILLGMVPPSYSGSGGKCRGPLPASAQSAPWPDQPKRPFDVLKYHLILDWRKVFETRSQRFSGVNTITLQVTSTTPSIELDAALMKIDSLSINGSPVIPTPQPTSDEKLLIPLPAPLQVSSGSPLSITIGYHRDTLTNLGIYFFPRGSYDTYDRDSASEDVAYTMSEPTDAHYWMPCMDLPYDKAESEISIIVPNGIEAASNGSLLGKSAYTPTSTEWNWKSDEPISTYLMVADASNFIHWGETHHRTTAPGDTVRLEYYAWPSDYYQDSVTNGTLHNAKRAFSNTSQIMSWLEARYGGFPFEKYGQVPVSPFSFGGMEHQSLTTIHRKWLRGDDQGIAHEMAHQWFGDKTTCETFKDIWLNEGFATYSETIWYESWGAYDWYIGSLRGDKAYNFFYDGANNKLPTYDPPANDLFNDALTYCKGACVLHMLRRMVGNDTMFFNSLRDYSNAFAYSTANTAQFRDYMGTRLGIDLTGYMDQWIFGGGWPGYDIKWAQNKNNTLFIRVNQYQTVRDHFTMPLKFFAYHGSNPDIDTLTFENNSRSQAFEQSLGYMIDSLKFDDDALLLSEYVTASGDTINGSRSVALPSLKNAPELTVHSSTVATADFAVYIESGNVVCRFAASPSVGEIEIYSSVGTKVAAFSIAAGESLKIIDAKDLSSGMYFLRYSAGGTSQVVKTNILR